jgi:DNA-binding transcriptional MerR regulator
VGTWGVSVAADPSVDPSIGVVEPNELGPAGAARAAHARRKPQRGRARSREECFRSGEVTQILGISRRQLHYWARTGLVRPSSRTRGGHHRYRFQDLVALKTAKRLIDAGVSVQRIRRSIEALQRTLPTVRHPLAELVLVATGDVVLVLHEGMAFEAATGQEWVFEIAPFRRELESWQAARDRTADVAAPHAATV